MKVYIINHGNTNLVGEFSTEEQAWGALIKTYKLDAGYYLKKRDCFTSTYVNDKNDLAVEIDYFEG